MTIYNTHSFKLQALKSYGCSVIGWYLVRTIPGRYPGQSLRRRPGQMLSNNDFLLMLRRRSRCTPPPPHPLSECRHLQRNSFLLLVAIGEGVTVDSKSLAQFCRPHSKLQTRVSPEQEALTLLFIPAGVSAIFWLESWRFSVSFPPLHSNCPSTLIIIHKCYSSSFHCLWMCTVCEWLL